MEDICWIYFSKNLIIYLLWILRREEEKKVLSSWDINGEQREEKWDKNTI